MFKINDPNRHVPKALYMVSQGTTTAVLTAELVAWADKVVNGPGVATSVGGDKPASVITQSFVSFDDDTGGVYTYSESDASSSLSPSLAPGE